MSSIKESIKGIISRCEACQKSNMAIIRTKKETIKLAAAEPVKEFTLIYVGLYH